MDLSFRSRKRSRDEDEDFGIRLEGVPADKVSTDDDIQAGNIHTHWIVILTGACNRNNAMPQACSCRHGCARTQKYDHR